MKKTGENILTGVPDCAGTEYSNTGFTNGFETVSTFWNWCWCCDKSYNTRLMVKVTHSANTINRWRLRLRIIRFSLLLIILYESNEDTSVKCISKAVRHSSTINIRMIQKMLYIVRGVDSRHMLPVYPFIVCITHETTK